MTSASARIALNEISERGRMPSVHVIMFAGINANLVADCCILVQCGGGVVLALIMLFTCACAPIDCVSRERRVIAGIRVDQQIEFCHSDCLLKRQGRRSYSRRLGRGIGQAPLTKRAFRGHASALPQSLLGSMFGGGRSIIDACSRFNHATPSLPQYDRGRQGSRIGDIALRF